MVNIQTTTTNAVKIALIAIFAIGFLGIGLTSTTIAEETNDDDNDSTDETVSIYDEPMFLLVLAGVGAIIIGFGVMINSALVIATAGIYGMFVILWFGDNIPADYIGISVFLSIVVGIIEATSRYG